MVQSVQTSGVQASGVSRLFNDRKISTKIMIGFACVLAITAAISVGAYTAFGKADAGLQTVVTSTSNSRKIGELERHAIVLRASMKEYGLNSNPTARDEAKKAIASLVETSQSLAQSIKHPGRKKQAEDMSVQFGEFSKPLDKIIQLRQEQASVTNEILTPSGERLRADFTKLRDVAGDDAKLLAAANEANDLLMQVRINSVKQSARHDKESADNVEKFYGQLTKHVSGLGALINDDQRKLYDDIKAAIAKYRDGYIKTGAAAKELAGVEADIAKVAARLDAGLVQLRDAVLNNGRVTEQETREVMASTTDLILVLAFGGLGLGAVLAWLIGRVIAKPIVALVPELEKLAHGDFNVTVPGLGRKDEVGQIAGAIGMMAEKVSATIGEIKASGREVTNASAEISSSTTDLSQRTEEQAASLEETSAAMEELSATVQKNSESAQHASQSANATKDVADRGGQVVAQAVKAMARIEDSSRKISDIIGVIDEIARQTNLLALNAAVEAARAGEAGRGFAVVASEVRSLAQRSSQAAKDINGLITDSNGQVKEGVDLVNRAGASLSEIVESIKSVATIVSEIASASVEQSIGIQEINKALTQMDEVTQQNTALVEENAATAKTLEHQAKAMDDQVAFFQVGDGGMQSKPAGEHRSVAAAPSRGPAATLNRSSRAA
jgi:methyl-accepting chemotaxis protein/CHASE3 domain sensor protein